MTHSPPPASPCQPAFEPLSCLVARVRGVTLQPGPVRGRCTFCARLSDGYPAEFGENFMSYQHLQGGSNVCPACRHMLTSPEYRRRSWLASSSPPEFRELKRPDVLPLLENPPEPPFALCLTTTGKKHGWIPLMMKVSYSRSLFFVSLDESVIAVRHAEFTSLAGLCRAFLKAGAFKSELHSGKLSVRHYEACVKSGLDPEKLKPLSGSPMMELALYSITSGTEGQGNPEKGDQK